MPSLFDYIFYSSKVNQLFSDESIIQAMLDVEAALASAQAKSQIIPAEFAGQIKKNCRVEFFDIDQIKKESVLGGNINIPLVKQLTALVQLENKAAAAYVHFGATSQDIIDTANMLQLKKATTIISAELDLLIDQLVFLTQSHRTTLMVGRTLMQHAAPISFGLKVAGWLEPLIRSKIHFETLLGGLFSLQLGGAVGDLSAFKGSVAAIMESMAAHLSLEEPAKPWHTQRDRIATLCSAMAILSGNIAKMAKDMSLMMQTEVGELSELDKAGKGTSSAMPHKKNPVGVISILANNSRIPGLLANVIAAMPQEHERAAGLWHAEWETVTDIIQLTAGITNKALSVCQGLQVHTDKMLKNLELTNGLIYAEKLMHFLLPVIGRSEANELIESCCRESQKQSKHLKEICIRRPEILRLIGQEQINLCFDPNASLVNSDFFIDRVLNQLQ